MNYVYIVCLQITMFFFLCTSVEWGHSPRTGMWFLLIKIFCNCLEIFQKNIRLLFCMFSHTIDSCHCWRWCDQYRRFHSFISPCGDIFIAIYDSTDKQRRLFGLFYDVFVRFRWLLNCMTWVTFSQSSDGPGYERLAFTCDRKTKVWPCTVNQTHQILK